MYSCSHCHWDGEIPIWENEKYICPQCESEVQKQADNQEIYP